MLWISLNSGVADSGCMFHLNSKCFPLVCRTEGSAGGLANCQEPEHARACSTFEKHWSIRFHFPCLKMFKVASKTNRGSECSAFPPFGPATHAVKPGKGRSTFKLYTSEVNTIGFFLREVDLFSRLVDLSDMSLLWINGSNANLGTCVCGTQFSGVSGKQYILECL